MKLTLKTPAQWRKERKVERGEDPDEDTSRKNIIAGVSGHQTRRAMEAAADNPDDIPF